MDDVGSHRFHRANDLRCGRCSGGGDRQAREIASRGFGTGIQRGQHGRCTAHVRHFVAVQQSIYVRWHDFSQAHVGRPDGGNGPRVAPSVAVEQRQGPKIDRSPVQAHFESLAHSVDPSSPRVEHYAFRETRGARGVVDGNRVTFVQMCGRSCLIGGGCQKVLVFGAPYVVGHWGLIDDLHVRLNFRVVVAQAAHRAGEFRVEDQHLRAGVIEDVRDFSRGQANVERNENRSDAHRPEHRFEHRGYVRG